MPSIIRASKFVLEDEKGNTRAILSVLKAGPRLRLWDKNGERRAGLGAVGGGPMLALWDEKGKAIWRAP